MDAPFAAGGLITTETEVVDLGLHHDVQLSGIVERRTLRIGFGRGPGIRLELARSRPTSVVAVTGGQEVVHRLPANPDPWIVLGQQLLLISAVGWLLPRLLRRS
jgi:hypothetical protein